ncbi:MAG: AAA family ATPase [Haliscomenobacter sp.]|uniref:AAA family ATPase n=1 Tax=Haliscomenobacter sp. TaxID=2717303 RepID=UPI0029AFB8B5|nr:AAA family ATPase [Haliscomenobacter sp.]MDX2070473.1 AAA family ATPase [Haliscomenobacter sp.]
MPILRINQLELQQIGPFGDLTLNFPEKPAGMEDKAEIHILTGENGTGKSTMLEIMTLIGIGDKHFEPTINKLRRSINARTILSISPDCNLGFFIAPLKEQATIFKETTNYLNIANKYVRPYQEFPNLPFGIAFFAYSGHRRFNSTTIIGIKEIENHPFENALDFQQSINPANILQWIANNKAGQAFAHVGGDTQELDKLRQIMNKLENTISEIIQKSVRFQVKTKPYNVVVEVDGEELEFNQLPDGLKSIISWIADLLMRMDRVKWENDTPVFERNFILFLDEIEVHMHPVWQRKILPVVQKLFPNAQIFISTHSPFVVGSVDGARIHKLVKPNGDSKLAEGYPKLSEDGNSFRYWLDEVFDVSAEFGIGAENQLKEFYALRDEVLKSNDENLNKKLLSKGRELAEQSTELHQIIEMELRQLNRRKSLSLSI